VRGIILAVVFGLCSFAQTHIRAATLESCDFSALQQAAARGGTYTFNCDAVIVFTNTIRVGNLLEFDSAGHKVVFDGQGVVQLFAVQPEGSLTLKNLTLTNGYHQGAAATFAPETPRGLIEAGNGEGGAVRNNGIFRADNCSFLNNAAQGGNGFYNGLTLSSSVGIGTGGAIFSSRELLLDGCLIANCVSRGGADNRVFPGANSGGADGDGGAIFISSGTATINGTRITGNSALASSSSDVGHVGLGGGIYVASGSVFLVNSQVSSNSAVGGWGRWTGSSGFGAGGGIYAKSGTVDLTEVTIEGNQVTSAFQNEFPASPPSGPWGAPPAKGGGIFISDGASMTVTRSTFSRNVATATDTGGPPDRTLFVPYYSLASGYGGGAWNEGRLVVSNSTWALNVARCGDAYYQFAPGTVSRGNAHGGAIYAAGSNSVTQISFSTIAFNRADRPNDPTTNGTAHGGGIYHAAGHITIDNSILAENGVENVFGSVADAGHNLVSDASLGSTISSTIQTTNVLLGFLGLYGGPTETVPVLPGSPAIDAAECLLAVDQRSVSRPVGAGCDIGAFEAQTSSHYLVITASPTPWTPLTARAGAVSAFMGTNSYVVLGKFEPGQYQVSVSGQGVLSPVQTVEISDNSLEIVQVNLDLQKSYTADLAVNQAVLDAFSYQPIGSPVPFGHAVIYEIALTNQGPGTARGIRLSNSFFGAQSIFGAGAATVAGDSLSTNLPDLEPFSSAIVRFTNSVHVEGTFISNRVNVASSDDPNPTNNGASSLLRVGPTPGDRLVQFTTVSTGTPDQSNLTVVIWDPVTGKAFFGSRGQGLKSYDPITTKFEDITGFNLAPFGVVSLAKANRGGLLYIGAGDKIIRYDTRTRESSGFNLETNFSSYLAVSPADSNVVAVANDQYVTQIYKNGALLADSSAYGGAIAFNEEGTELYLRPTLLTFYTSRWCDLLILSVTANGLVLKETMTDAVCGPMTDAIEQDGFIYFNPARSDRWPYPYIYDVANKAIHKIDRLTAFVAPHPGGAVSLIGSGYGGTTVQRLNPPTFQPVTEVSFPFYLTDHNYGFKINSVAAMGENRLAVAGGQGIFFLDLSLPPSAPLQVWSIDPSHIALRFAAPAGKRCRIEKTTSVLAPGWTTVQEITGSGEEIQITLATGAAAEFFRLARLD
jgi:hypothetical protein